MQGARADLLRRLSGARCETSLNHGAILKKESPAIAEAIREVAALDHKEH
ncbi:hypothetical protein SAMN02787144_101851 [Streptomyces atratus]|uniref:Uncharacterized protein n=1 Tax=Streptomyces atratus TaxID=1893 RepID=A0A1K2ED55_STRAR|nr:hypothetical protein SAMN02787144_101851 [Streptomyces atratus]